MPVPKPVTDKRPLLERTCKRCDAAFTTKISTQVYCSADCREAGRSRRPKASASDRGYGKEHRALRRRWKNKMRTQIVLCARCSEPIDPNEPWHLDHEDDRSQGYRGPAHEVCNTRAGGAKGGRATKAKRGRSRF